MSSLQNTRKIQPIHHHQRMRGLKFNSRVFVNTLAFGALVACCIMLAIAQNTSQTKCSETYTRRSQSEKINLLQSKQALKARKLVKRDLTSDDLEPNPGPEPTEVSSDNPENYAANSDTDANGNFTDGEETNAGSSASAPDYSSGDGSDSPTDATDLQPVHHASSFHSSTPGSANIRPSFIDANHNSIRTPQGVGPVMELARHQLQPTIHNHHLQPQSGRPLQLDSPTTPNLSAQNVRRNALNLPPTTTVPTTRFSQPTSNQQVRSQQQQQTQPPRLGSQEIPPSAFNVDMGADRMLIKPVQPLQHQQPPQRSTTITPVNMPTMANIMDQEMATETINQELSTQTGVHNNGGTVTMMSQNLNGSNQRRQDLIYPTRLDDSSSSTRHHFMNSFDGKNNYLNDLQPQEASQVQVPSICYTPLALLIVILVTMMVTIVVCFCTHIVIRYLSRHQFDLIESSKQFDTKHGSSSSDARSMEGAAQQQQQAMQSQQGSTAILFNSNSNLNKATCLGDEDNNNRKQSCMLSLFRADQTVSPDSKALQKLRDEHGFAFDNPYFRDEPSNQRYLRNAEQSQQQQHQQQKVISSHVSGGGLLQTATNGELMNGHNKGMGDEQQLTGNEQLHFIEHHISNLHNRQVTSSVKELSILGSPENQNVAQVVDLTSEEQRSRILADPKEGDLIAVDISGHDIIGLGFDICGNQHDGVFVKSVFSRGPARESGCIETGDRIKCLNISFDNVTLQDACDILNCGSPYKMRLLLEKRVAPPKLTNKLTKSPAPRKLNYGSQLALVADGSNSSSVNLTSRYSNNQQLHLSPSGGGGALSVTKSYFKRLANLVSPSSNRLTRMDYGHNLDLRNQYDCRTSSNLNISGISNGNELFIDNQAIPYLGSAAARRNLFSGDVPFTSDCINNQATNNDTQTTITQQVVDPSSFGEANIISRAPIVSSNPTMKNVVHEQRCLSHSDSIGSNLRGRFSVDSAEMLNVGSSTNDFNTDSSLDYQNRNANHRLHGPQFEQRIGNRMQVEDITDLRMIASQNQLDSHNRTTLAGASSITTTTTTNRRQSVACVMQTSGSGSIKTNSKDRTLRHHLEQTQSQPEIALRETNEDREATSMKRPQFSEDVLAATSADERIEILPNSRTNNNPPTNQDTRNGRFQMISSMSTPSVNLLGSNNQQQQQQQQTNSIARTTNQTNSSSSDWRKIPSLRRKKTQQEESIREEIGGSDSSYADSTSKLVDRKKEQLSTGTSSNDTSANSAAPTNMYKRDSENSRPTVTQIARVLESRTESLSSSSATMSNNNNNNNSHNSRDALTSLVNRNKSLLTERDDHD